MGTTGKKSRGSRVSVLSLHSSRSFLGDAVGQRLIGFMCEHFFLITCDVDFSYEATRLDRVLYSLTKLKMAWCMYVEPKCPPVVPFPIASKSTGIGVKKKSSSSSWAAYAKMYSSLHLVLVDRPFSSRNVLTT